MVAQQRPVGIITASGEWRRLDCGLGTKALPQHVSLSLLQANSTYQRAPRVRASATLKVLQSAASVLVGVASRSDANVCFCSQLGKPGRLNGARLTG